MCLGIPGRIEEVLNGSPLERTARVSFGGICKDINIAYVPHAEVGDYVIVHVGFAISRIDEREAQRVFEYLAQIGELDELE
ncbi:HypC/HybG/HupF family hydrogenase formation chaperone [Microbulbifer harenosus]|uniref:HypC/HybG/HupF family hydrogenase formation chaperone n=1 Tax=Microbulbifer harenosus TaxID=2576840 RepID=A0ABY2UFR2_9GAMM|nr:MULTISPECIES: HypC/HybG/HupF family hydrogenase formation chaperone [Microbulbifer]QIL89204.1 HypC/HybG/HupF family hydrogenase formation chaperone [Microbulbifer sp. SH-1]TLM76433.1 HypC/HybG/HupF family hydrogenase formation chaperone [Microbulbifer harenosus]